MKINLITNVMLADFGQKHFGQWFDVFVVSPLLTHSKKVLLLPLTVAFFPKSHL